MALALHRTVDELKASMTVQEFTSWFAYFELRPFGVDWDDLRMAVLSANIVAALTGQRQTIKDHLAHYRKQAHNPKNDVEVIKAFIARSKAWQTQSTSAK